jgi:hypothetical protein
MILSSKVRVVYVLSIFYAIGVIVNAIVAIGHIPDSILDIARAVTRCVGVLLITYALYMKQAWAYWVALVGSGFVSVLGLPSLLVVTAFHILPAGRLIMAVSILLPVIGVFVLLLNKDVKIFFLGEKKQKTEII